MIVEQDRERRAFAEPLASVGGTCILGAPLPLAADAGLPLLLAAAATGAPPSSPLSIMALALCGRFGAHDSCGADEEFCRRGAEDFCNRAVRSLEQRCRNWPKVTATQPLRLNSELNWLSSARAAWVNGVSCNILSATGTHSIPLMAPSSPSTVTKESKTRLKASASSPRELTATRCEVRIPRFWNAWRRSARSMRLCSEASKAVNTEPALDCMHASCPRSLTAGVGEQKGVF